MTLLLASTGSYPRIGDSANEKVLRQTYAKWEVGDATDKDLERAQEDMVRLAIEEQVTAGLDLVTDGQIRWYDPISHFFHHLEGVEINGLLRYFDTNSYFRQPVIKEPIQTQSTPLAEEYRSAQGMSNLPVKPVLTGPYTLARSSILDQGPYDLAALANELASLLAKEIEALEEAGASIIQVDEPAILDHEEDFPIVQETIARLHGARKNAKLALYTYFGDASLLYGRLQELPVDILGLDFTYSESLPDQIASDGSSKAIAFGLIDGRNTRLEKADEILPLLERLLPSVQTEGCFLNPSSGLEYLPRDRAYKKLENMRQLRDSLEGKQA